MAPATTVTPNGGNGDTTTYLTFLHQIDLQRVGLIGSFDQAMQQAAATGQSGGTSATASSFSGVAQDTMRSFLAQKAPQNCAQLASDYFRLLQDQTIMIGKAGDLLAKGDLKNAGATEDAAQTQIASDAVAADASLAQVFAAENAQKTFTIVTGSAAPAAQTTTPTTPASQPAANTLPGTATQPAVAQPISPTPNTPTAPVEPTTSAP